MRPTPPRSSTSRTRPSCAGTAPATATPRPEEHTSELQTLMRNSYSVFPLDFHEQTHSFPTRRSSDFTVGIHAHAARHNTRERSRLGTASSVSDQPPTEVAP